MSPLEGSIAEHNVGISFHLRSHIDCLEIDHNNFSLSSASIAFAVSSSMQDSDVLSNFPAVLSLTSTRHIVLLQNYTAPANLWVSRRTHNQRYIREYLDSMQEDCSLFF
jgi:predicted component of type VI protein secretion system